MIRFKRYNISVGIFGAVVAFAISNYISYGAGQSEQRSVLIETMEKYRNFYSEVKENSGRACDETGKLRGLYLSQFKSMLPVIEDEVEAPYDNPCPSPRRPSAPEKVRVTFCSSWEDWEDFLNDPTPTVSLNFPEGTIRYKIVEEWKNHIIVQHRELLKDNNTDNVCGNEEECES